MPRTKQSRAQTILDNKIDALYRKHAPGRQIDLLKIPVLFQWVKDTNLAGTDLEEAVKQAINKFCDPI